MSNEQPGQPADAASGRGAGKVRAFLHDLRRRTQGIAPVTPLPEPSNAALREVDPSDDLTGRFVASAEAAGCRVRRASADTWVDSVVVILQGLAARRVVVEPLAASALIAERAAALAATLQSVGIAAAWERDDETLFSVDAAVTGVWGGIAETGTIVCVSGEAARGSSLIPPAHVAIIADTQIVADLFDAFERLSTTGPLPANVNFITGPSKTADIEGVLVTGMHGPGEVHIVVVSRSG